MAIELTERAAQEVKTILQQQNLPDGTYLRVGIRGGGCAGFNYVLDLVDQAADEDERMESHGVNIIVDPKSYLYVNGMVIDFRDELMGRGFVYNNPNATNSCGCGSSFSA